MEEITQCQEILMNNFRKCEPRVMFDALIGLVNSLRGETTEDILPTRNVEVRFNTSKLKILFNFTFTHKILFAVV